MGIELNHAYFRLASRWLASATQMLRTASQSELSESDEIRTALRGAFCLLGGCAEAIGLTLLAEVNESCKLAIDGFHSGNTATLPVLHELMLTGIALQVDATANHGTVSVDTKKIWNDRLAAADLKSLFGLEPREKLLGQRALTVEMFTKFNGRKPTVLVVDDDESIREAVGNILSVIPVDIIESSNGHEAWTLIDSRLVDVVVSDFLMPFLDGMELIKRMRVEKVATPVILISGFRERFKMGNAIQSGAFAFLDKPFSMVELELQVLRGIRHGMVRRLIRHAANQNFLTYLMMNRESSRPEAEKSASQIESQLISLNQFLDLMLDDLLNTR
jgi:DNA-binding response OmpR family regulator